MLQASSHELLAVSDELSSFFVTLNLVYEKF